MQSPKMDVEREFSLGARVRLPSGKVGTVTAYYGGRYAVLYEAVPDWQPNCVMAGTKTMNGAQEVTIAAAHLRPVG